MPQSKPTRHIDTAKLDDMDSVYSSFDDFDAAESDLEDPVREYEWSEKDFRVGKSYFEYVVTRAVVESSPRNESLSSIESAVARKLRGYSYAKHFEVFTQSLPELCGITDFDQDDDGYSKLLTILGAVLRTSESSEEASLSRCIKRHLGLAKPQHVENDDTFVKKDDLSIKEDRRGNRSYEPYLAQYSMALKEHGDKTGDKVDFRVDCISFQPVPEFEAILTFKGAEFSGRAKTKKEARHLAAKSACDKFGICT